MDVSLSWFIVKIGGYEYRLFVAGIANSGYALGSSSSIPHRNVSGSLMSNSGTAETRRTPIDVAATANRVAANIEKVILGKRHQINLALVAYLCEGHILLEDVPGVAKTMLARALARSVGSTFKRIQCTPDLLPTDVTGVSVFNQKTTEFEFRAGPIFAQTLLADEINRTTPRTQSSLLEAMAERRVSVDGQTYVLKPPFLVIATQNPVDHEGTFPLPEAQLDRFLIRLSLGYPSIEEEGKMLQRLQPESPDRRPQSRRLGSRLDCLSRRRARGACRRQGEKVYPGDRQRDARPR